MIPDFLLDRRFFLALSLLDRELAESKRQARCPYCLGPLHYSTYRRKVRGEPDSLEDKCCLRLSLCCGRRSCRRRTLPPSCIFLGRKVYVQPTVLILLTLHHGAGGQSINRLARTFGVARSTIVRWISFFRVIVPKSRQWQRLRGLLPASVHDHRLPVSLIEYFSAGGITALGLLRCLWFLAQEQEP